MLKKNVLTGFLSLLFLLASFHSFGQQLKAYQLFDKNGVAVDFGALVQATSQSEIVLFGELHNNPVSHWLQLELTMALHELKGINLLLGMEMFEADDQLKIDEYFSELIPERNFRQDARFWNNYNTDIKPLVEFARENSLRLIATNIPRRYAALVNREGLEGLQRLSAEAKRFVAPLPVAYDPELPGYKAMLTMGGMPAHSNENFPKAQAIKDATMAHFILKNYHADNVFIHFHGTYHSNNYEGIVWYLKNYRPETQMVIIATVEQEEVNGLDESNKGLADFIIAIPQSMTKTY
jgi:uncharacterized iron-regulated protein